MFLSRVREMRSSDDFHLRGLSQFAKPNKQQSLLEVLSKKPDMICSQLTVIHSFSRLLWISIPRRILLGSSSDVQIVLACQTTQNRGRPRDSVTGPCNLFPLLSVAKMDTILVNKRELRNRLLKSIRIAQAKMRAR